MISNIDPRGCPPDRVYLCRTTWGQTLPMMRHGLGFLKWQILPQGSWFKDTDVTVECELVPKGQHVVTLNEISEVITAVYDEEQEKNFGRRGWPGTIPLTKAVHKLISGNDPAVYVIRESAINAVRVEPVDGGKWWIANDDLVNACESPNEDEVREAVEGHLYLATGAEAVARVIEKQTEEDVEEREIKALIHETFGTTLDNIPSEFRDIIQNTARRVVREREKNDG
jgi:hypothetical protein